MKKKSKPESPAEVAGNYRQALADIRRQKTALVQRTRAELTELERAERFMQRQLTAIKKRKK